ncbi:MAG: tRNA (guanosine(46)-N7)-methyltransferase TrmB [Bacteroidales bacterium]|nr:tRNA (guanosine(46)-N7)-methyltransferase TrmB [Bacteroidales bacterium]
MGHHKLQRFKENLTFPNLFQVGYDSLNGSDFEKKGRWSEFFGNDNPITLELGCGKGDYTVALARMHHNRNFIGVDIKGARLWRGAKTAIEDRLDNVAFIRTRIELIDKFFAHGEVDEIWLTFCDPQPKKPNKRLSSPRFLDLYRRISRDGTTVHLKTDSLQLYQYTRDEVLPATGDALQFHTEDLYNSGYEGEATLVQTFYEQMFLREGKAITYMKWLLKQ